MSLVTPNDFNSYGGSGTYSAADLQMAIDLAEFDIGQALTTFVEPTTVTEEEYLWPIPDGKIQLLHAKVISLTEVKAKYSLNADCVWIEDVQCGVILNAPDGLIKVRACNFTASNCMCGGNAYPFPYGLQITPDRLVVTYVCGFSAVEADPTTAIGKALRMAIILRARDWLQTLTQGDAWEGAYNVPSYSSMDYSERRDFQAYFNELGPSPFSTECMRIIKRLKGKPAIMLRSSGRYP